MEKKRSAQIMRKDFMKRQAQARPMLLLSPSEALPVIATLDWISKRWSSACLHPPFILAC